MSEKYDGGQTIPSFVRDIYSSFYKSARVTQVPDRLQKLFAYDVSGHVEYKGVGAAGLATSDDGWRVYKYTYSGDDVVSVKTADGIWDDRATLTYE